MATLGSPAGQCNCRSRSSPSASQASPGSFCPCGATNFRWSTASTGGGQASPGTPRACCKRLWSPRSASAPQRFGRVLDQANARLGTAPTRASPRPCRRDPDRSATQTEEERAELSRGKTTPANMRGTAAPPKTAREKKKHHPTGENAAPLPRRRGGRQPHANGGRFSLLLDGVAFSFSLLLLVGGSVSPLVLVCVAVFLLLPCGVVLLYPSCPLIGRPVLVPFFWVVLPFLHPCSGWCCFPPFFCGVVLLSSLCGGASPSFFGVVSRFPILLSCTCGTYIDSTDVDMDG